LKVWNKEAREELLKAVTQEIADFRRSELENTRVLLGILKQKRTFEMMHPGYVFNERDGHIETTIRHLKWNFQEFRVNYTHKRDEMKLWKYYVKELLIDGRLSSTDTIGTAPRLHPSLVSTDVPELWRHLELKYITCAHDASRRRAKKDVAAS